MYLSLNHHFYLDTNDLKISMNGLFLGKKNIYTYLQIQQFIYLSSNDLNIAMKYKMCISALRLPTLIFAPTLNFLFCISSQFYTGW